MWETFPSILWKSPTGFYNQKWMVHILGHCFSLLYIIWLFRSMVKAGIYSMEKLSLMNPTVCLCDWHTTYWVSFTHFHATQYHVIGPILQYGTFKWGVWSVLFQCMQVHIVGLIERGWKTVSPPSIMVYKTLYPTISTSWHTLSQWIFFTC